MNSRFEKFIKSLEQEDISREQKQSILDELHKSFATLSQEEQKFANVFISEVRSGNVKLDPSKTFKDYITEYQFKAKNIQIQKLVEAIGVDVQKLKDIMSAFTTEANLNEYGRFDALKETVDREKAKNYFENLEGKSFPPFKISIKIDALLKKFISNDGVDV